MRHVLTKPPLWPLLVVGLGTLVVPLDSAVNVDFPDIVRRFDLAIPDIQWIVISYVLTQTSLMLVFGRIGDMVGHRRVFLAGTAVSVMAFAACALAPSYGALLAARVLQGVSAGLVLSCGPALATGFFPEAMRARVLGLYTMMFGLGAMIGPLAASLLIERFGWSAAFSFRIPIALLAFCFAWLLPKQATPTGRQSFDTLGGALLVVGTCSLLMALNRLRDVADVVIFAALAIVCIALFVRTEHRSKNPILDLRAFRDPGFAAINVANWAVNLAGFSLLLLGPFYLSRIAGLSALPLGVMVAASSLGIVIAAPVAGRLAERLRPRTVAGFGAAASAVGLLGVALAGPTPILPLMFACMVLQGIGLGTFQVAYFDLLTATLPRADRGVAGALGMVTRSLGVATGATLLMLLFEAFGTTGFEPAFRATMLIAAAIPTALVIGGLILRPTAR
jgi:EmrB/QacA subfamily drug resistance transporter